MIELSSSANTHDVAVAVVRQKLDGVGIVEPQRNTHMPSTRVILRQSTYAADHYPFGLRMAVTKEVLVLPLWCLLHGQSLQEFKVRHASCML